MIFVTSLVLVQTFAFVSGDCFFPFVGEVLAKSCDSRRWFRTSPSFSSFVLVGGLPKRHMARIQGEAYVLCGGVCNHLSKSKTSSHSFGATVAAVPAAVSDGLHRRRDRALPPPSQVLTSLPQFKMPVVWTERRQSRKGSNSSVSGFLSTHRSAVRQYTFDIKKSTLNNKCGNNTVDHPKLFASALPKVMKVSQTFRGTSCLLCGRKHDKRHELDMARHIPLIVRFAPSPTGSLHVGGARTALVNHAVIQTCRAQLSELHKGLIENCEPNTNGCIDDGWGYCKTANDVSRVRDLNTKSNPRFILRIDDTDISRNLPNAESELLNDLRLAFALITFCNAQNTGRCQYHVV